MFNIIGVISMLMLTVSWFALLILFFVKKNKIETARLALKTGIASNQQWISTEPNPFLRKEVFVVDIRKIKDETTIIIENKAGRCASMSDDEFIDIFEPVNQTDEQQKAIETLDVWGVTNVL